jgi:RND family efflux transporter MFP subunit
MTSRHLLALVVAATAIGTAACDRSTEAAPESPPAPPTVSVVTVTPEKVSVPSEWVATLDGFVNAQIRPQVSGYLIARHYQEGGPVRKGQVLFEVDARPFAAALAQAKAALAKAEADLGRTERDVARDRPLAEQRAIPQSQLDNDVQANLAAKAAVQAAQAAVDTAELNIGFTRVRSLIDGVAAIATAQIGDLVGPTTLLTTVSQVDPIRAYFSLSEREYLGIAKQINGPGGGRALWKETGGLQLTLADGSVYPRAGTFLAADREIDPRTGTIRISASFPNPGRTLRPGQYGRVSADTRTVDDALLVPQRAVSELQGANQLRIVGAGEKVQVVNVTLGGRVDNRWIVTTGLTPGARVIVDAPQLRDGTLVQAQPWTPEGAAPATGAATAATGGR